VAVQLLENWLLKEQEKIQTKYRHLNQVSVVEPDILFIGDSIVEYYPLQELFGTAKTIVNRGIRGYQTGLLLENLDAHLYGGAVDKIVLLIGTNDWLVVDVDEDWVKLSKTDKKGQKKTKLMRIEDIRSVELLEN